MDKRDEAAKAAHDIWSHWMLYQFIACGGMPAPDGSVVIPPDKAARWRRQMQTEFCDLTEAEQASDYEIAERFILPLMEVE